MADYRAQADCPTCNEKRLVVKRKPTVILHAFLGAITFGLWVPFAFIAGRVARQSPWRCTVCGQAMTNKEVNE